MNRQILIFFLVWFNVVRAEPVLIDFEEFPAGLNPPPGEGVNSKGFSIVPADDPFSFYIEGVNNKYATASSSSYEFGSSVINFSATDAAPFRLLSLNTTAGQVIGIKSSGATLVRDAAAGYMFDGEWRDLQAIQLITVDTGGASPPSADVDDIQVSFNPDDALPVVPNPNSPSLGRTYMEVEIRSISEHQLMGGDTYISAPTFKPEENITVIWPGGSGVGQAAIVGEVEAHIEGNVFSVSHNTYANSRRNANLRSRTDLNTYSLKVEKPKIVNIAGTFTGNWDQILSWTAAVHAWLPEGPVAVLYEAYNSSDTAPGTQHFSYQTLVPAGTVIGVEDAFRGNAGNLNEGRWYANRLDYTFTFTDPEARQMGATFEPFDASNQIRPNDVYFATLGIETTSIADGDTEDFDAVQIDPASVRVGPGRAANIAGPLTVDFDGDSDIDIVFGIRVEDTGIVCGDTELGLEGWTFAGETIYASATIETVDCDDGGCHP